MYLSKQFMTLRNIYIFLPPPLSNLIVLTYEELTVVNKYLEIPVVYI